MMYLNQLGGSSKSESISATLNNNIMLLASDDIIKSVWGNILDNDTINENFVNMFKNVLSQEMIEKSFKTKQQIDDQMQTQNKRTKDKNNLLSEIFIENKRLHFFETWKRERGLQVGDELTLLSNIINKLNGGSTIKSVISNIGPYSSPSPIEIKIEGGIGINKIFRSVTANYIYVPRLQSNIPLNPKLSINKIDTHNHLSFSQIEFDTYLEKLEEFNIIIDEFEKKGYSLVNKNTFQIAYIPKEKEERFSTQKTCFPKSRSCYKLPKDYNSINNGKLLEMNNDDEKQIQDKLQDITIGTGILDFKEYYRTNKVAIYPFEISIDLIFSLGLLYNL